MARGVECLLQVRLVTGTTRHVPTILTGRCGGRRHRWCGAHWHAALGPSPWTAATTTITTADRGQDGGGAAVVGMTRAGWWGPRQQARSKFRPPRARASSDHRPRPAHARPLPALVPTPAHHSGRCGGAWPSTAECGAQQLRWVGHRGPFTPDSIAEEPRSAR